MFASTRSNGPACCELRRRKAGGADRLHQMPGHVEPGVFPRDLHRGRIDVAGQNFLVQRLGRGDRQHAGAGAEIEHAPRTPGLQHMIEQQQAAARGAVMAGAERQRRLDLDAELVGRDARAIMLAVHDETPGRDRNEVLEAGLDPVPGLDGVESDASGDILAGSVGHELAQQRLIRRVGKMHGDVPAPVRPFERGDGGLALEKDFGKHVDDVPGGVFVADREAGAVGGGSGSHWGTT